MKQPIRVAVTGPAGQIGYSLLFRIASGEMLGPDQPVILQLLEVAHPDSAKRLTGMMMELSDCAFPLLADMIDTTDPRVAFRDAQAVLMVGARPRGKGMDRRDLLTVNGQIFSVQGRALDEVAARDVKVLVVGNPCNTNALIAMKSAPSLSPTCFSAMLRLDHNRAVSRLADKVGASVTEVSHLTVWGNHSNTMYADIGHCLIGGRPAGELVDRSWYLNEMLPAVANRGAAIIEARGASSAASAAAAAIDHMRDWFLGAGGAWSTMGVPSDGSYGIPAGLICGRPVICDGRGGYEMVEGLEFDAEGRARLATTVAELENEAAAAQSVL